MSLFSAEEIKKSIQRNDTLLSLYRKLKIKWINYFAEHGEVPRRLNHLFIRLNSDPILQLKIRKKICDSLQKNASEINKKLAQQIEVEGYAIVDFNDININSENALTYIENIVNTFRAKELDKNAYQDLNSGKYEGKALCYHLYVNDKINPAIDPFMQLICNRNMIEIATLYLGYLPTLDFTNVMMTPIQDGKQFGAQLWHKDLHHKKSLKIFFTPLDLTLEHGPFQFFPPRFSTLKYFRYSPQSSTDEQLEKTGLNVKDAITFFGGKGKVLFVDTARCLHRGGMSKVTRYTATAAYCSPIHSFNQNNFRLTTHYNTIFNTHRLENEMILKEFLGFTNK